MTGHIRWLIKRDMPEVMTIERRCFDNPYTEAEIIAVFRQRSTIGMVYEEDDRVIGFMLYDLQPRRLDILDFAVHPEFQRQGVGLQMVQKLIGKLTPERRNRLRVIVRETNLQAQLFFQACSFRAVKIARRPYANSAEDGYVMDLNLAPANEPVNRIASFLRS
jgi:ribosomal-protein-alanine N-acetyltransferase